MSVAVYNRTNVPAVAADTEEVELQKSNILLLGPTGWQDAARPDARTDPQRSVCDRPDATALTEAGYVGEDVENILLKLIQAADFDVVEGGDRDHQRRGRQDRLGGQPVDHARRR